MHRFKQGLQTAGIVTAMLTSARHMDGAEMEMARSDQLARIVDQNVRRTVTAFSEAELKSEEIALTLVDLRNGEASRYASHRGGERIYPASVIKLFYLEATHRWMEEGKLQDAPELRRAMRDMIVDSYNEATHYVVDLLTVTTSGPELPANEMKDWEFKRNAINRYFQARGFSNINVNQKPWGEGPYGRERVFVGEKSTNRNVLTTDSTARLLTEIVTGKAVSRKRSAEMMELLARDRTGAARDPDDQAHGFTGPAVPPGGKLWSKAGWTSETRHDAAYVETPGGAKFVLVIFIVNHSNEREIIPTLAKGIISDMQRLP
jgi:beta-lactamase class A